MALTQPDIRPSGPRQYRVAQQWTVTWRRKEVTVFKNFRHDGASVPRIAWTLAGLTPDGLIRAAALAHDFVYRGFARRLISTRREADVMFYDLMVETGIPRWRAYLAWSAVRVGGWASWKR